MDKLELDARVARLERRLSLLTAFLAAAALAAGLFIIVTVRRAEEASAAATIVSTPVPPVPATAPAFAGVFGAPDVSMGALRDELIAVHELLDQGLISEDEWESKKARLLLGPVVPGDLRSDLEQVRQLADQDLICEDERDTLRARLLRLDEPSQEVRKE